MEKEKMKEEYLKTIKEYLSYYKEEKTRQEEVEKFIRNTEESQIIDWNNFDGHIVASAFIYNEKNKKFLVLYHKDLEMYLYPGGHIDKEDKNILEAAKRETREETGLTKFKEVLIGNKIIPIDIDTHRIPYNKRLNLKAHTHFDFRYLFILTEEEKIKQDTKEMGDYKWIDIKELEENNNYGKVVNKLKNILE
ncbi:MAG: NUDIX domain-containing protein [Bacilli bacterium]|nr:NUDIX domain-containing protein [Bacilli bacterium]